MNRRQFLIRLGTLLPLAAAACSRTESSHEPSSDLVHDCIVIGAGVSGLTLARELTQPPAQDLKKRRVLVLEAGSRIGGRVRTDRRSFDHPVELGAEYVHMPPLDAALWREVARYRLPLFRVDKTDGYMFHPELSARAVPIVEATLRWNLFKALSIWKELEVDGGPDLSGEQYLLAEAARSTDLVEQDFKRMVLNGHLGALEDRLSMRGFDADRIVEQLKSTKEYYIEEGYDVLLHRLGLGVEVRLAQRVRRIVAEAPDFRVETESGDVFRARSVAITVSVGVLKAQQIEFVPELPARKREALEHLEMSHHSKVHIEFVKRFWPEGMSMLQRPDRTRRVGKTYFVPYAPGGTNRLLTALIMGSDSARIDDSPQDRILRDICSDLSECFPEEGDVLALVKRDARGRPACRVTHWRRDPDVRGGVSYIKYLPSSPLAPEAVRESYASCVETPGLFWAGEAAALFEQASSVHGAHSAALRTSLEIQSFLDGKPPEPPREWAALYHQLYGLRDEMKWHPRITRTPSDPRESEKSWQARAEALIREG
jgi:monoamine oxidase